MSVEQNLREMERSRERYWRAFPKTSPIKLQWRAMTVRHCFHVLPGESILELGAGSGLWTEHLWHVLRGRNPITAAFFNADYQQSEAWRKMPTVKPILVEDLASLPGGSFDYVVGTAILCHNRYAENLKGIMRLLKPGGQILFFENNFFNPQVFAKSLMSKFGYRAGNARCQIGMSKFDFLRNASHQGFVEVDVIPYDIIHPRLPRKLISAVQSVAFIVEQAPAVRNLCGTLYLWARRPGVDRLRPPANLAIHGQFRQAVSVVIPAHNEEMNIAMIVSGLVRHFDEYIHEILIVDDNSRDRTADAVNQAASREPRVRLLSRTPPNGVGLALRDGVAAASGEYILTMDCDFVQVIPELRDLFEAVATGYDGAVGSRFTHESIMVNYPFPKILGNRIFHFLANRMLRVHVGDISNNLKLFRARVLKDIEITQPHFAANAEIGLKAIGAGYRIKEVPISWINRTLEMGSSSFRVLRVGPAYFLALWELLRSAKGKRQARTGSEEITCDVRNR